MKKRVICFLLCGVMLFTPNTTAFATSRAEIQNEIDEAEEDLEEARDRIDSLSDQQAAIAAQIDDTNAELVDMMIRIETTEQGIADTQVQIEDTQAQIEITTEELAVAEADKQEQYESMKNRIRYIYENGGDAAWFRLILEVDSIASMLNRAEYAQSMHDYDRKMLAEFAAIVHQVAELKTSLETQKTLLEEEKASLEAQKESLEVQEAELQVQLEQLEATNADYADKIAEARSLAESISALIAEQEAELERIAEAERRAREEEERRAREEAERLAREEEERRRQEQEAQQNQNNSSSGSGSSSGSSGGSSSGSSSVPSFSGTATGSAIVAYADQFVGNPYVWGGNSLTNGIDCSHFVYQVLKNCGVWSGGYLTSAGWRTAGRAVASLDEAQAGDVICYSGHVAIYDGYGGIVEAKGSAWGITHDRPAYYGKTILAIRRFI